MLKVIMIIVNPLYIIIIITRVFNVCKITLKCESGSDEVGRSFATGILVSNLSDWLYMNMCSVELLSKETEIRNGVLLTVARLGTFHVAQDLNYLNI